VKNNSNSNAVDLYKCRQTVLKADCVEERLKEAGNQLAIRLVARTTGRNSKKLIVRMRVKFNYLGPLQHLRT